MKNTLSGLLFIAALVLVPATTRGASLPQEVAPEPTPSITVFGYGSASAAPDSVRVKLYIGEEPTYGPSGPELSFIEPTDLEHVRDSLIEEGVDEDTIEINSLSRNYSYGSGFAGEVAFSYTDLDRLRPLLQALVDIIKERRGPGIQGANIVFRVENCAALEEEAMRSAIDNARQRAKRMAGLLDVSLGRVIAVSEDVSQVGGIRPAASCIATEGPTSSGGGGYTAYATLVRSGSLANSPSKVEVAVLLKATFALE